MARAKTGPGLWTRACSRWSTKRKPRIRLVYCAINAAGERDRLEERERRGGRIAAAPPRDGRHQQDGSGEISPVAKPTRSSQGPAGYRIPFAIFSISILAERQRQSVSQSVDVKPHLILPSAHSPRSFMDDAYKYVSIASLASGRTIYE